MFCSSLAPKDDEVEDYILSYLYVSTTVPMDQRKRKLSHAVIVHCTDVHVPLERLRGEKKIELEIVHCGKRLLNIYTLILFVNQLYASSPEPSSYVLQNKGS